MKHHKLAALLLSSSLLLSLASCTTTSNNTTETTESPATTTDSVNTVAKTTFDIENMTDPIFEAAGIAYDTVVATVGDLEIKAGDVLSLCLDDLSMLDMYAAYGMGDIPWGEADYMDGMSFEEAILTQSAELAGIYAAIPGAAEAEGLVASDGFEEATQATLDGILESLNNDETAMQYAVWQAATTIDDFWRNNEANDLYSQLFDLYYGENGTKLPDDEEAIAAMEEAGTYNVKHILISNKDEEGVAMDEEGVADALARAEDILATLEASDDLANDFHEMMVELSEDPGVVSYPEGYVSTPGQMVPEFEEASLALEVGGMSGLVESTHGYHIIYRLPLEADTEAAISAAATAMQEDWIADLEILDILWEVDLEIYYSNITLLQQELDIAISELISVGSDDAITDGTVSDDEEQAEEEEVEEEEAEEDEVEEEEVEEEAEEDEE